MGATVSLLEDRMRQPTRLGSLPSANAVAAVGNPACGDVVTLYMRIEDDVINDASFESLGSAYQLATASVLCDCVVGQHVDEARSRTTACILDKLPDLPQRHRYLARLSLDALRKALDVWHHGAPEPGREGTAIDVDGGRAFVRRILGNGRAWTTREVDAMAEAEAITLPCATVRFLSEMQRAGLIAGQMDVERRIMVWAQGSPARAPSAADA